jgi:serralysin
MAQNPIWQTTPPNFLNLELLVGNINGTGSSDNNTMIGYGIGDNIIDGGAGNDTIAGNSQNNIFNGGSGKDTFVFGSVGMTALTQLGVDLISDFTVGQDKIQLSESIFHIPTVGINNFIAVADDAAVATAIATIVYSRGTGNLFYNSGIAAGVQFAQLGTGLTLSQNDFLVGAAMVV